MERYQIRKHEYRHISDSPVIFEGSEEEALKIWESDGYKKSYDESQKTGVPFFAGLYKVTYTLLDGENVKSK